MSGVERAMLAKCNAVKASFRANPGTGLGIDTPLGTHRFQRAGVGVRPVGGP